MVNTDAGPGFKILAREDFSDVTYSLVVHHPLPIRWSFTIP